MVYHMVALTGESWWPCLWGVMFGELVGSILYFVATGAGWAMLVSMVGSTFVAYGWIRDLGRESTYVGIHGLSTQMILKAAVVVFIGSEVALFGALFWAYFHTSLSPAGELGFQLPPIGVFPLDPFSVPLMNSLVLVSSGVTLTVAHHLILSNLGGGAFWLAVTLMLALLFSMLQGMEYWMAGFTLVSSVYGSVFYTATGLHGMHVMVGSALLATALVKLSFSKYSSLHHVSLEVSAWYWHFVDVVWLFLFVMVYWWSA